MPYKPASVFRDERITLSTQGTCVEETDLSPPSPLTYQQEPADVTRRDFPWRWESTVFVSHAVSPERQQTLAEHWPPQSVESGWLIGVGSTHSPSHSPHVSAGYDKQPGNNVTETRVQAFIYSGAWFQQSGLISPCPRFLPRVSRS